LLLDEALQLLSQAEAGEVVNRIARVKILLAQIGTPRRDVSGELAELSPRQRQTLHRLLAGDSEKQAASYLHLKPSTVHDYVKALHRHFDVNSRAELLAKFIPADLGLSA
jgi:DNA-binding NarL/FixJ family response regulator